MNKNPLLNPDFLKQLYAKRNRNIHIKIISHNLKGEPLECLEGMVTGGSINIDGNTPIRRSCTLSMCAKENSIPHTYYWATTTQFKLLLGIENHIDTDNYPDIIWFPMGWYLVASFSYSKNANSYTINLSGKDKMCMLNGELGGTFTALSTDFGTIQYILEDGTYRDEERSLKDIVYDLVQVYGREEKHNIIINDLDIEGNRLLEYRGTTPMYLLFDTATQTCVQYTVDTKLPVATVDNEIITTLDNSMIIHELLNQIDELQASPTKFYLVQDGVIQKGHIYTSTKIEYEETIGYTPTVLSYAGKLVANAGETVTSVLDKIKNSLAGYYEYFYNIDGQFIFQKKRTSLATNLTNLRQDSEGVSYIEPALLHNKYTYNFDNNEMLTQLANTMLINNLKNDYTVWGQKGSAPIHMRYAIDKIPRHYKNYDNVEFAADLNLYSDNWRENNEYLYLYNWREILYQMAIDDKKRTQRDNITNSLRYKDFREKLIANNPQYYTGYTNYEQYYLDIEGFWRGLYNPDPPKEYIECVHNEETNNKHVYDYHKIDWEQDKIIDLITDWSKAYVFDNNMLQKWIDTHNLMIENPWSDDQSAIHYYDLLDYKDTIQYNELSASPNYIEWSNNEAHERIDHYLNELYYKTATGYNKIIDSLDFHKEQLYVKVPNPDYIIGVNDAYEPEQIYTEIYNVLTEEMKDKIYVSVQDRADTAKKYEDYFALDTYKEAGITFIDSNVYILNVNTNTYEPIQEITLHLPNHSEPAIIWSHNEDWLLTDETAAIIQSLIKNYNTQTYYTTFDSTEAEQLLGTTMLYIKGQRAISKPYWWYKNNITSEPQKLVDIILSDYFVKPNVDNMFCKYTDIYILKEEYENNQDTDDDIYISPLKLIKINKDEIYIRHNYYVTIEADGINIPNKVASSEFVLLSSLLNVAKFKEQQVELYYKTDNRVDILDKIVDCPEFESIYFMADSIGATHSHNESVQKYMYKSQRDLYGDMHITTQGQTDKSLILYWELYYNYHLPKEPIEIQYYDAVTNQETTKLLIDCRNCWQTEVYRDFNKANFWIDFLDSDGDISQNSVSNIGIRQKVERNQTATALNFGDIPALQWVYTLPETRNASYKYILITEGIDKLIDYSAQGTSCKDAIDVMLNKYATINNTLSFSSIPIYHLEPNTEVFLNNKDLNIYGAYEINRITLPLAYNGVMQLSVTKIVNNIV